MVDTIRVLHLPISSDFLCVAPPTDTPMRQFSPDPMQHRQRVIGDHLSQSAAR